MPTYQYACTDCGDRSEVVQRFTDDPLTVCTACGGRLRKVFSPVGIVFKGSGFYRTDSRNGSATVGAGKDGSGSGPNGANGSDSSSGSNGSASAERPGGSSSSDSAKNGSSGSTSSPAPSADKKSSSAATPSAS